MRRFVTKAIAFATLALALAGLPACGWYFLSAGSDGSTTSSGSSAADSGLNPETLGLFALMLSGSNGGGSTGCPAFDFGLPAGVGAPVVPPTNCMTAAKVDLGRHLFYDKRLSGDGSMSCASCHRQAFAFTDRVARPLGITGETHPRNSQQLSNTAYHTRLTWANPTLDTLETQAAVPMFSESGPSTIVELGTTDASLDSIRSDADYRTKFSSAFGGGAEKITDQNIRRALSSFQRTMLSFGSPFDRGTMSAAARRGQLIFDGEVAECFHCHGGFNFTDTFVHNTSAQPEVAFHNNGLYTEADYDAMSPRERGLVDVTGNDADEGKFRAPSLRNVALTFPYMHDGSITCDAAFAGDDDACATNALEKVIAHYMSGGKAPVHAGVDPTFIRTFSLTTDEIADLVAFLKSLTDSDFISDTSLSNPRPGDANFGP